MLKNAIFTFTRKFQKSLEKNSYLQNRLPYACDQMWLQILQRVKVKGQDQRSRSLLM